MSKRILCIAYNVFAFSIVVAFLFELALGEYLRTNPGAVRLKADPSVINSSMGAIGLVFNTSDQIKHDTLGSWRKMNGLIIDSIIFADSVVLNDDSNRGGCFQILSSELLDVLEKCNTRKLVRPFDRTAPGDTLYFDSKSEKWHITSDLTWYYDICFDTSISVNMVMERISNIDNKGIKSIKLIQ